jgi:hypothetical protein
MKKLIFLILFIPLSLFGQDPEVRELPLKRVYTVDPLARSEVDILKQKTSKTEDTAFVHRIEIDNLKNSIKALWDSLVRLGTVTPDIPIPPPIEPAKYYVSASGYDTAIGTITRPFKTIEKLITVISPGDLAYIRGGTYTPTVATNNYGFRITGKAGKADSIIRIFNYPGEIPVFDLATMSYNTGSMFGFMLNTGANYFHLKGFEVKNMPQPMRASGLGGYFNPGLQVYSSYCIIENFNIHHNSGPGINGSGKFCKYLNTDSHNNYDANTYTGSTPYPGGSGDGIHVATTDSTNTTWIEGCRFWNNSDDGEDSFGSTDLVESKNVWSFHNGYIPGTETHIGDGCGFKAGPTSVTSIFVKRKYVNCIAAKNYKLGFTQNFNTGQPTFPIYVYNCFSYSTVIGFAWAKGASADILRNNISYGNTSNYDGHTGAVQDHNSWNGAVTVTDADFVSLDWTQLALPRKSDGSLPDISFGTLAEGSDVIDAGTNVGIPYKRSAPDMGVFEKP